MIDITIDIMSSDFVVEHAVPQVEFRLCDSASNTLSDSGGNNLYVLA